MMIMIIISLLILSVFFAGILLYFFPKPPVRITGRRYDAAIVLGCPCQNDGSLSPMQQRRMNQSNRPLQTAGLSSIDRQRRMCQKPVWGSRANVCLRPAANRRSLYR